MWLVVEKKVFRRRHKFLRQNYLPLAWGVMKFTKSCLLTRKMLHTKFDHLWKFIWCVVYFTFSTKYQGQTSLVPIERSYQNNIHVKYKKLAFLVGYMMPQRSLSFVPDILIIHVIPLQVTIPGRRNTCSSHDRLKRFVSKTDLLSNITCKKKGFKIQFIFFQIVGLLRILFFSVRKNKTLIIKLSILTINLFVKLYQLGVIQNVHC